MNNLENTAPSEHVAPAGKAFPAIAVLVFLAIFAFHAFKGLGTGPHIMPDETTYNFDIRLRAPEETLVPNHLYYFVYRVITLAGDQFLSAAQVLNAFLYTLAGVFIYLMARRLCGAWLSLYVAAISLLSPFSAITAFLMPESPYFAGFWIWCWHMVCGKEPERPRFWAYSGAGLGLLSLVKVHAVFLVPALALTALLFASGALKERLKPAARNFAVAVAAMALAKFGVGFLLAGTHGFSILGTAYSGDFAAGASTFSAGEFLYGMAYNLWGHIQMLGMTAAPPLGLLAGACFLPIQDRGELPAARRLAATALPAILMLLFTTSAFTSHIDFFLGEPGWHEYHRLQARFYLFLVPSFFIIAGYAFVILRERGLSRARPVKTVAALLLAAGIIGAATCLEGYRFNYLPDAPDFTVMFTIIPNSPRLLFPPLVLAALLSGALILANGKWAVAAYLFLLVPAVGAASWHRDYRTVMTEFALKAKQNSDDAVRQIANYIGDETGQTAIVYNYFTAGSRIAYFLDDKRVEFVVVPPGETVSSGMIGADRKWVVIYGLAGISPDLVRYSFDFTTKDSPSDLMFKLVRVADFSYDVDLLRPERRWPLARAAAQGNEMRFSYAIKLPNAIRIGIELTPEYAAKNPVFAVDIPGGDGTVLLRGKGGNMLEAIVEGNFENEIRIRDVTPDIDTALPPGAKARRLLVSPVVK